MNAHFPSPLQRQCKESTHGGKQRIYRTRLDTITIAPRFDDLATPRLISGDHWAATGYGLDEYPWHTLRVIGR